MFFKRHWTKTASLFLFSFLFFQSPLWAQQSDSSATTIPWKYLMSSAGGAALGAAAGGLSGSSANVFKGVLTGGGLASTYYYFTDNNAVEADTDTKKKREMLVSFITLGAGLGWTFSNKKEAGAIGGIAGFGTAALIISLKF